MSKVAVDINDSGITRGSSNHVYMYVYLVAMISLVHACSRLRVLELLESRPLQSGKFIGKPAVSRTSYPNAK